LQSLAITLAKAVDCNRLAETVATAAPDFSGPFKFLKTISLSVKQHSIHWLINAQIYLVLVGEPNMKKSLSLGLTLGLVSLVNSTTFGQEPPPAGKVTENQTVIMAGEAVGGGGPTNFQIMSAGSDGSMNVMSFSPSEGFMMGSSPSLTGDPFSMLTTPEIQAELDVVGDQRDKIMKLQQDYAARIKEQIEAMRSSGFTSEKSKGIRETIEELQARQRQDIDDLLLPHQRTRLSQLALQARMKSGGAVNALNDKKIMEDLGMTDEQLKALKEKAKELNKELEEKISKMRDEYQQTLLKELTKDQRSKLEEMIGDAFEFPKAKTFEPRKVRESREATNSDK
jgi:hypothetical protein